MDTIDFLKLTIPSGYKEIINDLISKCNSTNFNQKIIDYSISKQQISMPQLISPVTSSTVQSQEFLPKQTVMLSQAEYLGDVAKTAPLDTQPLLYHYAENSLFSFFVYSLISFTPVHSFGHGMKILWNSNIDDVEVQFSDSGFFSRLVDCYSICGCNSVFSPLELDFSTQQFVERTHSLSLKNKPTVKVSDLINIRKNLGSNSAGFHSDILDFVLLFVCSSLARYRPFMWIELTRGEKGIQSIWFNQCFSRFDLLKKRLKDTIIHFKEHGTPVNCCLYSMDSQII